MTLREDAQFLDSLAEDFFEIRLKAQPKSHPLAGMAKRLVTTLCWMQAKRLRAIAFNLRQIDQTEKIT